MIGRECQRRAGEIIIFGKLDRRLPVLPCDTGLGNRHSRHIAFAARVIQRVIPLPAFELLRRQYHLIAAIDGNRDAVAGEVISLVMRAIIFVVIGRLAVHSLLPRIARHGSALRRFGHIFCNQKMHGFVFLFVRIGKGNLGEIEGFYPLSGKGHGRGTGAPLDSFSKGQRFHSRRLQSFGIEIEIPVGDVIRRFHHRADAGFLIDGNELRSMSLSGPRPIPECIRPRRTDDFESLSGDIGNLFIRGIFGSADIDCARLRQIGKAANVLGEVHLTDNHFVGFLRYGIQIDAFPVGREFAILITGGSYAIHGIRIGFDIRNRARHAAPRFALAI